MICCCANHLKHAAGRLLPLANMRVCDAHRCRMAAVIVPPYLVATGLTSHMSPCLQAKPTNKSVVELVKEATGASEEDVKHTLEECDYDVNKATNMLIDGAALPSAPSQMLCCGCK